MTVIGYTNLLSTFTIAMPDKLKVCAKITIVLVDTSVSGVHLQPSFQYS